MEKVTLRENHPNQCEIMVGKRRFGFLCYGERMPINVLPPKVSQLRLTKAEQTAVAKEARRLMAERMQVRREQSDELAKVIAPDWEDHQRPQQNQKKES